MNEFRDDDTPQDAPPSGVDESTPTTDAGSSMDPMRGAQPDPGVTDAPALGEDEPPPGDVPEDAGAGFSGDGSADATAPGLLQRLRSLAVLLALIAAFGLGTRCGGDGGAEGEDAPAAESHEGHGDHGGADSGEQEEVWTCSMHPQIRMPKPGQCPICGMDLIPADSAGGGEEEDGADPNLRITLTARARALAQVRTAKVERVQAEGEIRLLGRVDYDETRLRMITPWTAGRIDRLYVRVTGERVRKGQVVATLYSPEIYAAMRDLKLAQKQADKLAQGLHGSGELAQGALAAAREKLRLLGVSKTRIAALEQASEIPTHVKIRAQAGGTILQRLVEEGDYVQAGTVMFHVADLSRVWVQIDAYETDLPHLALGSEVTLQIQGAEGEPLLGKVTFIDPVVDPRTRTTRVRVEVDNPDGALRPGMFADAIVRSKIGAAGQLVVPASAVLFTGERSVVYVAVPGKAGTYELRNVRLGPKAGPVYPVLDGLAEDEEVVAQGAFVMDADLQLKGGRSMMTLADDRTRSAAPRLVVPHETLSALEPVMRDYLAAAEALASDDVEGARKALAGLAETVNALDLPGPNATRKAWRSLAGHLVGHAQHGARSKDEGSLREGFEALSVKLIEMLEQFGNPFEAPVRVAFCPMAFDSKGARWVQAGEKIRNPYYGSAMLGCGDVQATLAHGERLEPPPASDEDEPPPPPPTHNHGG